MAGTGRLHAITSQETWGVGVETVRRRLHFMALVPGDFPADAWVLGEVLALGSFPRDCMGAGETKEGTKKKLRLTRRDQLWEGHPADHRAPQEGPSEPGGKELRGWVRGGPSPQPCVVCTALFVLIGKATFWPLLETVFFASPGPLALTVDCILVRKSVVHFNSC